MCILHFWHTSIQTATFQELNSDMWLVAAVLDKWSCKILTRAFSTFLPPTHWTQSLFLFLLARVVYAFAKVLYYMKPLCFVLQI